MGDLDLEYATASIISGLGIVPATTLAAPLTAGQTSITLTDASHFIEQGFLVFPDGWLVSGYDEPLPIAPGGIVGNVVSPDFGSVGYSGFQFSHGAGTKVLTNLVTGVPDNLAEWISLGDPAIFVHVLDQQDALTATRLNQSTYTVLVQFHNSLIRPQDSTIDSNLWAFRQQVKARNQVETVANAIRTNPRLTTSDGNIHAESLGQLGGMGPRLRKDWAKLTRDDVTEQMMCALRFTVREQMQQF